MRFCTMGFGKQKWDRQSAVLLLGLIAAIACVVIEA